MTTHHCTKCGRPLVDAERNENGGINMNSKEYDSDITMSPDKIEVICTNGHRNVIKL